ncbi:MAG: dethiobiotin synthase [Planctomycetota bacterium]
MILFVTGIDTEIGKTVATGLLAAWLQAQGHRTITQKLVQTGGQEAADDVCHHRRLMGIGPLPEDQQGLTCPAVYPFPASPHLAARLAGEVVDIQRIVDCATQLAARYEFVLVEGVGGLLVPLTQDTKVIDLIASQAWPVVLVTAPRLGSINHTLLSLEAIEARGLELAAVVYNLHYPAASEIVADTRRVVQKALVTMGHAAPMIDLPSEAGPGTAVPGPTASLQWLLQYAGPSHGP